MGIQCVEDEILLNGILHDHQIGNANIVYTIPQVTDLKLNQLMPINGKGVVLKPTKVVTSSFSFL